ncbi:MAG: MopE-related protein [Pseudomonadota bacterium]
MIIGVSPLAAFAADCTPDSGFEWCYENPNPWAYTPKIQVDINYNTASKNGYTVAASQYTMRFKCNGTLYYDSNSCWYGGCNGQSLGGGVTQKVIGTAYAANPPMKEIRCYTQDSDGWSYAGYNPWTSNVYVVHCYQDGQCSQCNHCTTSGSPSGWQCQLNQETCNGLDDDCDGSIDENWSTLGNPCEAGTGECHQNGTTICKPDGTGTKCSVTGGAPTPEVCDGKDNDCDGGVDETFPLGNPCTVGTGTCANQGVLECKVDGSGTECSADPFPPQLELCDGLDNDCDGAADEIFPLGDPCSVGVGQCANQGALICKADGLGTECSVSPFPPKSELCDALDNDCDGAADEDFPLGDPCSVGKGQCANSGVLVCTPAGLGTECSVDPLPPQAELCDALDNDCDGVNDEDFPLGDPCTVGAGQCTNSGVLVCTPGGAGTECNVDPFPSQGELCDGLDNDCDGGVDEIFPLGDPCTVGIGQCENMGAFVCKVDGLGTECSVSPLPPQSELCDALDNDCDGAVDEDFPLGDPCSVGTGQCINSGALVCTPDGLGTGCSADPLAPQVELCDALDNDCDGVADEDFPLGDPCSVGVGQCMNSGALVCTPGGAGTECDVDPFPPQSELCDGLDNDCDGGVDEIFPLGDPCTVGVGQCENLGALACKADGLGTECPAEPLPPQSELCDGLDNDCDGGADEDFDVDEACTVGVGQCENQGLLVCTAAGLGTECSSAPFPPQSELCDGLDNDCDGAADEDFDVGEVCSVGTGQCTNLGVRICAADGAGPECSVEPSQPQTELCDGLDNDCDGVADEDFDDGVLCTVGTGECTTTGISVCTQDGTGTECNVDPLPPQAEVCDGLDNDCDGAADEEYPLGDPCVVGTGQCLNTGVLECTQDGTGTACSVDPLPAQNELCDGLDNDCDDDVDEVFPLEEPCTVGTGECAQSGVQVCLESGFGTECSADPLAPQAELCDGLDNDCDGAADEDYPVDAPCSVGVGECETQGLLVCAQAGAGTECAAEPLSPQEEVCDGVDNDCDGGIDEDYVVEEPCTAGLGECENQGVLVCTSDGLGIECSAAPLPSQEELCDAVDNDCDGETDEDFAPLGVVCHVGVGICKAWGEQVCSEGGEEAECDATPLPQQEEVCDGLDNDCDGAVDQGCACVPGTSRPCGPGLGECISGTQVCGSGGTWGPCQGGQGPELELCDGLDNDCDGEADPGCSCAAGSEDACGLSEGECQPGSRSCVDGVWGSCAEMEGPDAELCDGLDNNCDGAIDEAFPDLSTSCTAGMGVCETEDVLVCAEDGLGVVCGAPPAEPGEETCNGLDDDCDGATDEDGVCWECESGAVEFCVPEPGVCDEGARSCSDEGVWGPCVPVEGCISEGAVADLEWDVGGSNPDVDDPDAAGDVGGWDVSVSGSHSGGCQSGLPTDVAPPWGLLLLVGLGVLLNRRRCVTQ